MVDFIGEREKGCPENISLRQPLLVWGKGGTCFDINRFKPLGHMVELKLLFNEPSCLFRHGFRFMFVHKHVINRFKKTRAGFGSHR